MSLFCRSAPRPSFLKLKRITGHKSLYLTSSVGNSAGSGSRSHSLLRGGRDGQDRSVRDRGQCAETSSGIREEGRAAAVCENACGTSGVAAHAHPRGEEGEPELG